MKEEKRYCFSFPTFVGVNGELVSLADFKSVVAC
jgi:hypothetical protein